MKTAEKRKCKREACEIEFIPKRRWHVFCSPFCRTTFYWDNHEVVKKNLVKKESEI